MEIMAYKTQAELLLRNYMLADSRVLYTSIIGGICACKVVFIHQTLSASFESTLPASLACLTWIIMFLYKSMVALLDKFILFVHSITSCSFIPSTKDLPIIFRYMILVRLLVHFISSAIPAFQNLK